MTHYHYFTILYQLKIMSNYQSIPRLLHLRTSCGFYVRQRHQGLGLPSGMWYVMTIVLLYDQSKCQIRLDTKYLAICIVVDNPIIQQSNQPAPFKHSIWPCGHWLWHTKESTAFGSLNIQVIFGSFEAFNPIEAFVTTAEKAHSISEKWNVLRSKNVKNIFLTNLKLFFP